MDGITGVFKLYASCMHMKLRIIKLKKKYIARRENTKPAFKSCPIKLLIWGSTLAPPNIYIKQEYLATVRVYGLIVVFFIKVGKG